MAIDFSFIDNDILGDIADAIRFVEGSTAGIAPADYPDRIKALDKYIPDYDVLNFTMPNGGTVSLNKVGSPTVVQLEYWTNENKEWVLWEEDVDGNRSVVLTAGQTVYIRNKSNTITGFSSSASKLYTFAFTDITNAAGNTNSLLVKNGYVQRMLEQSFRRLFYNCSNLATAPDLPSVIAAESCYREMFSGCSLLAKAPYLPARSGVVLHCYGQMFYNCTSLNYVAIALQKLNSQNALTYWLDHVAPTGDFYCPTELTISTNSSGIPSGWTRHDI